jgi:2-alkenal reductase
MNTRFGGIVIAWALVLVTAWLGDRLYHSYVYVVDEPKLVVPEGKLRAWEKSNIELFQAAGGSVAYMTTEQVRFNPFRGVIVAQGAGSGFIWDKAGHVVTNFHVIDGANTVYVQLHAGDSMRAGEAQQRIALTFHGSLRKNAGGLLWKRPTEVITECVKMRHEAPSEVHEPS